MASTKDALRKIASRFDGVEEGVACAGTKIESKTYCVRGRAFLFVGAAEPTVVRFKVGARPAAAKKAGAVGSGGWAKIVLDGAPPAGFADLIAESHALVGGGKAPARRTASGKKTKRK